MIGRVIEVAGENRHLSLTRGFMLVESNGQEMARVPLDDIGVVLVTAHGATYSNPLIVALAERGVGFVICAPNHRPVAWLWSLEGHHVQAARMRAQIDAPRPLGKRLWKQVVRCKIRNQAAVLRSLGRSTEGMEPLAGRVRSGDPENLEAQAARRYWPIMFGPDFRRDRALAGANALLNYGYTVLRALTARAVVAAGLHPSLGIHHRNRSDHLSLADDLMEPFRPIVDLLVVRLVEQGTSDVTAEAKRSLAGLATLDMASPAGTTPIASCLERLATSLAQSFETGEPALDLPLAPLPLDFAPDRR